MSVGRGWKPQANVSAIPLFRLDLGLGPTRAALKAQVSAARAIGLVIVFIVVLVTHGFRATRMGTERYIGNLINCSHLGWYLC